MFNSLRGKVSEKLIDTLYLFTGGIEWDITVPATDMAKFPLPGEEARVYTWLYHRDDQMRLFGFVSAERRSTFLELLKVEGIGPRGAVKIMGGIEQEELEKALETGDLARLEAVPGLGKKTAQKMILALKGRLTSLSALALSGGPHAELAEALAGMGYDKRAAVEALARAEAALPPGLSGAEKEKLLFKQAIIQLSV